MAILESKGFYSEFVRKGNRNLQSTHYCPGCGHGIVHKLVAEAMVELGIQNKTILISPVGCAVFAYYYLDCGNVQVAHGRAPAAGTGIARSLKDKVVISYQGDGDLAAIGFNATFQAANRGENIAVIFINNTIYGMTGGQMAPTTLIGQNTTTCPNGRDPLTMGYPIHVCEVLNQLKAPVYIERVSVADTARIMKTKKAIRKALEIQRDHKGYAFVEILSPCPTIAHGDAQKACKFSIEQQEKEFPLGCLRDNSATAEPAPAPAPRLDACEFFSAMEDPESKPTVEDLNLKPCKMKFAGFGGQGILSLGLVIAKAAQTSGHFVSWLPTYGPEQRGGSAACSVTISGTHIGSPSVESPDVLVCLNQPSFEKFAPTVAPGGTIVFDSTIPEDCVQVRSDVKKISFPAIKLVTEMGMPKAANTAILGALTALGLIKLPLEAVLKQLDKSFGTKTALISKNREVFEKATAYIKQK